MAKVDKISALSILVHMGQDPEMAKKEIEGAFNSPQGVDIIAGQGNGTDWGPYWVGNTECDMLDRAQCYNNLNIYINAALDHKVPFVFSCGTPTGSNKHLDQTLEDLDDIARKSGKTFKVALIRGEVDKEYIKNKIRNGELFHRVVDSEKLVENLTEEEVDAATRIVAQMGPEPIMKALDLDVDGVITGRALDVGVHMSYLLHAGFERGPAAHFAKTLECASVCLEGKGAFCSALGTMYDDHFDVTSPDPEGKATIKSVSGHALYERRDPFKEENPGGYLDLTNAVHEQLDDRTVRITGGDWVDVPYTVKLEGAKFVGYRSMAPVGIREPRILEQLDDIIESVKTKTESAPLLADLTPDKDYSLRFRTYGKDAILGDAEIDPTIGKEVVILVEACSAISQELCDEIVQYAYGYFNQAHYPGRRTTSGNVESPYSPHFIQMPAEYRFNVWHLMPLDDPCEPFPIEIVEFPRQK